MFKDFKVTVSEEQLAKEPPEYTQARSEAIADISAMLGRFSVDYVAGVRVAIREAIRDEEAAVPSRIHNGSRITGCEIKSGMCVWADHGDDTVDAVVVEATEAGITALAIETGEVFGCPWSGVFAYPAERVAMGCLNDADLAEAAVAS